MTEFPIDLADTHVLVNNGDQRLAVWQRGNNPVAPFVFQSKKLAQHFHRNVLKKSTKWRVEARDVADFLGSAAYLRLPDGSDMFLRQRVPQAI